MAVKLSFSKYIRLQDRYRDGPVLIGDIWLRWLFSSDSAFSRDSVGTWLVLPSFGPGDREVAVRHDAYVCLPSVFRKRQRSDMPGGGSLHRATFFEPSFFGAAFGYIACVPYHLLWLSRYALRYCGLCPAHWYILQHPFGPDTAEWPTLLQ